MSATYKVRIKDQTGGFEWVTDEFVNLNGELIDVGSTYSEEGAEIYQSAKAKQIADFIRRHYSNSGIQKYVELIENIEA